MNNVAVNLIKKGPVLLGFGGVSGASAEGAKGKSY